ncbi:MAG TPA: alpha/beta fold hydrolase [Gemmatimonadaceae bacterium]|nr:alpha/beta fold hydrolase [Gemmatimonadaceae bacterium]
MPHEIPPPRASGFTTTTPTPLYWAAYGRAGAPRLLVLHGGPGAHHDYMLPQMLELAHDFELVFYDQRGGGRSKDDGRAPITWRTQVSDLALVAREIAPGPLTLLGYSWGGLLAMLYAIDVFGGGDPPLGEGAPRPRRMALIAPAPITRDYRDDFELELNERQAGAAIDRMRGEVVAAGLRERDHAAYRQRLFEISVAGYFAVPEHARDLTPFRVTGRVQQSVWESLGDFDLRPELGRIACPVLIVHGNEDPIPLPSSREAAHAMPNARLEVLDGSGHVPYVEAGEALFGALRRFLAETAHDTSR